MKSVRCTLPHILERVGEEHFPWALECVFATFNKIVEIDPKKSWKRILHDASQLIVDFLGAEAATIRIHEPVRNRLVSFGSFHFEEDQRELLHVFEDTIAEQVIATQSYVTVGDVAGEAAVDPQECRYRSMMAVPLTMERFLEDSDDVKGSMQIYFAAGPREISISELRVADMMSQRVSYVLARKRINDMSRVNDKKEWIVEKLFSKISIDKGVKMKDLFTMMVEELADIIRIQSCTLFTVSEDGTEAVLETGFPELESYHTIGKMFSLCEHPYLNTAVHGDRPFGDFTHERIYRSYLLIKSPSKSSLVTDSLRTFAAENGIHSILYVPLSIDDQVRYILVFDAVDKRLYFSDEDIEVLTFFGKELTQALEIERLDDILHDFKNPAIAIAGFARRVRRMIQPGMESADEIARCVDVVIQEGTRLQEMAMSLYPVTRPEKIDLASVVHDRFLINSEAVNEQRIANIELEADDLTRGVTVNVSKMALERVLDNLLNNATKAIPSEGGRLTVQVGGDDVRAIMAITNTGCVSPDELDRLNQSDYKGRGLSIVHRLVRTMNGKVTVSVEGNNTTFSIILPRHR
jgi:signal transduction histidine kinase